MKIDTLIAELKRLRKLEGNIEVTCTHTLDSTGFETTVENLIVGNHPNIGRSVRLWL